MTLLTRQILPISGKIFPSSAVNSLSSIPNGGEGRGEEGIRRQTLPESFRHSRQRGKPRHRPLGALARVENLATARSVPSLAWKTLPSSVRSLRQRGKPCHRLAGALVAVENPGGVLWVSMPLRTAQRTRPCPGARVFNPQQATPCRIACEFIGSFAGRHLLRITNPRPANVAQRPVKIAHHFNSGCSRRKAKESRPGRKNLPAPGDDFFRPGGAWVNLDCLGPSDESLGYSRSSLRDWSGAPDPAPGAALTKRRRWTIVIPTAGRTTHSK